MLARAHAFTIEGLQARHVAVEVDVRPGLPGFAIVGLADAAVREARERVEAAIRNSGYEFPARRITANLAPGDVPKVGAGLDLALACALLAASGQLPPERLERYVLFGELALDGTVRPARGTLAVAQATRQAGRRALALAGAGAREARLVEGLEVVAVERLGSAVRVLSGGRGDSLPAAIAPRRTASTAGATGPDLLDVRGQHHAVRALVIAAAGGHNLLLSGPPGTGKTMLAQRIPSILPPLSHAEAIEVTRIHSLTGGVVQELASKPPFRAPHHSITTAGLIGGAHRESVGEVVLAHNGVLFLDELSEFARSTLDARRSAPAARGRPRGDRQGAALSGVPGALHAPRRHQPVPVRLRRGGRSMLLQRSRHGASPPPAQRAAAGPDRPARQPGAGRHERADAADELRASSRAGHAGARAPGGAPAGGRRLAERPHGRAHGAQARATRRPGLGDDARGAGAGPAQRARRAPCPARSPDDRRPERQRGHTRP